MTLRLRDAAADARAGIKAQTLSRLLSEGLPVLDGIVVLPGECAVDFHALGPGPYVVRSSSPLEDRAGGSAAGLYESVGGVAAADVPAAIVTVRGSAQRETVASYLAARGFTPRPIAVLVQKELTDGWIGVARSTSRGFLIEERALGTPEWADTSAFELTRDAKDPRVALFARVERLLGTAVDIEHARTASGITILQARPVARSPSASMGHFPAGRWRLDAEHNPDPISTAQADLVARVDGDRFGPRARVIAGYLYVREDAPRRPRASAPANVASLRNALARAEGTSLGNVVATFVDIAHRYAEALRPDVAGARRALSELLRDEGLDDDLGALVAGAGGATTERDAALYALGRDPHLLPAYLARFGAYAPAWDVAIPCDDEDTERLLAAAARRARGRDPAMLAADAKARANENISALCARVRSPRVLERAVSTLRRAIADGETDDLVFFEGQRLVRRALLARGRMHVAHGGLDAVDEVFDLPLAIAERDGDHRLLAVANRKARLAAGRQAPPFRVVDRRAELRLPASTDVLHGRGIGGRARGIAFVATSLTAPLDVPDGVVLVVPAALPSLAPILPHLRALVTEHGGALSHAATLARELGLPAVVGVAGALGIPNGAEIYVDGERGRVLVLDRSNGPG